MYSLFDFHYACRLLLKRPSFSLFTITIMACGFGLCIYMYSVINTLVLKDLPFNDGNRMVVISPSLNGVHLGDSPFKYVDFHEIKKNSNQLEHIGYYYGEIANLNKDGKASRYRAIRSESDLFSYTGVSPQKGRFFSHQEVGEGSNPVAVIGHDLWQNYFGGHKDILSQFVQINGISSQIIGVMPEGFAFPFNNQIWLPSQLNTAKISRQNSPEVFIFAKLVKGYSISDVNFELHNIMKNLEQQYPDTNSGLSAFSVTFMDSFIGEDSKPIFIVMLFAVGFVLVLACCNVGNLLLARAAERAKESAIRIAHGAPTFRLVMQMMWESLIICIIGGGIGVSLAAWGLSVTNKLLTTFVPNKPPFWWTLELDSSVVLSTIVLIVLSAIVTCILPAWKMANGSVNEILRDGTRGAQSKSGGKISRALVIFEVAISCIVICTGTSLSIVVYQATKIDYGVNPEGYYSAKLSLPALTYSTPDSKINFYRKLTSELKGNFNIQNIGLMSRLPGEFTLANSVQIEGTNFTKSKANKYPRANDVVVFPGTLTSLGIEPKQGRLLKYTDDVSSRKVVVISHTFASRYWPNERSAIGKRLRWVDSTDKDWYTIVGIIPHIIHGRPVGYSKHMPTIYRSILQSPTSEISILIKPKILESHTNAIGKAVSSIDQSLPIYQERFLSEVMVRNTAGLNYISKLFNIFGIMALLLAGSGIYAVMSKSIIQRYHEIGVRRSLGSTETGITMLIMKQSWLQLTIGLAISAPLSLLVSPKIMQLIGNSPIDIYLLFFIIAVLIASLASLASYIPVRRAIAIEPMDALRYQ